MNAVIIVYKMCGVAVHIKLFSTYRSVILDQFWLDRYFICAYHNIPMAIERV
jgi:hypothetical protein